MAKKASKTAAPSDVLKTSDQHITEHAAELAAKFLEATADEQGTNTGRPGDEPATIGLGWFAGSIGEMSKEEHIKKLNTLATKGRLVSETAPFPTEAPDEGKTNSSEQAGQNAGTDTEASTTPLTTAEDRTEFAGDVADPVSAGSGNPIEIELSSRVSRLPGEGRSGCHERLRRLARAAGLPRGQGPGTAYNWALEQTNRLFAKLIEPIEPTEEPGLDFQQLENSQPPTIAVSPAPSADDGSVSGLADLPPGWPELPANAQLQVEIAWVTANRLRVRSGTGVDLSKALSPAPSYSALSWLETSILFPAKFADISVKATAQDDSEREFIKRERLAIEEIRSILAEMIEAED